jgi:hypothetical protein
MLETSQHEVEMEMEMKFTERMRSELTCGVAMRQSSSSGQVNGQWTAMMVGGNGGAIPHQSTREYVTNEYTAAKKRKGRAAGTHPNEARQRCS